MSASGVIVGALSAAVVYFAAATGVGIATGFDPFDSSTPRRYRVFLWPAACVWCLIFPEIRGGR